MKKIPEFKNEQEEAEFWRTHDSTKYIDWSKALKVPRRNLDEVVSKKEMLSPNTEKNDE